MTTKAGYWIGAGLMVFAVVGAIAWAVIAGANVISTIDDFEHVAIPGDERVRLDARKYVIYVEGPRADVSLPVVDIAITDPEREERVPIGSYGGSLTYSFNSTGSALATVTPPRAGVYRVRADGPGGYRLALGDSIGSKILKVVLGAFAIGAILGISGVVLLVATGVRRSRRRRAAVSQPWPAPPA